MVEILSKPVAVLRRMERDNGSVEAGKISSEKMESLATKNRRFRRKPLRRVPELDTEDIIKRELNEGVSNRADFNANATLLSSTMSNNVVGNGNGGGEVVDGGDGNGNNNDVLDGNLTGANTVAMSSLTTSTQSVVTSNGGNDNLIAYAGSQSLSNCLNRGFLKNGSKAFSSAYTYAATSNAANFAELFGHDGGTFSAYPFLQHHYQLYQQNHPHTQQQQQFSTNNL